MKVFEYVIIKHPSAEEKKKDKGSEILVGVVQVLAKDENQATMLAGRAIPESELGNLDRIEVVVRPF